MKTAALAIIPARGGSKRIPRKNVKEMFGKPLIVYSIEAAKQSKLFERVLVTTDCPEIASVAEAAGAEIPFLRDRNLADDITPVSAATVDMISKLDPSGEQYGYICQLMANCPLRDSGDIVDSYQQFIASQPPAQISVVRFGCQNPWWAMQRSPDFVLEPLFPKAMQSRSQDLPDLFCPTGAIWWAQAHVLRRSGTFHVPHRTGWEISWEHGIDIDTDADWRMANLLMGLDTVNGTTA